MNLLPDKEKETLKKGLRLRFLVAFLLVLSLALLVGTAMLLPSYFLTKNQLSLINGNTSSLEAEDEALLLEVSNLPLELNQKLKFIEKESFYVSSLDHISKIIAEKKDGVKINRISLERGATYKEKNGIMIFISGSASTRDALLSFKGRLSNSLPLSSIDLPVSNLTRNKDLPFTMNIFIEN